jgi:hypothetical protein
VRLVVRFRVRIPAKAEHEVGRADGRVLESEVDIKRKLYLTEGKYIGTFSPLWARTEKSLFANSA